MSVSVLHRLVLLSLNLALTGCASPTWKRMASADGLLDIFAGEDLTATPIERISGGGGQITTAHLRAYGKNVFVSGLVGRQSLGDPPPWSHVDVIVLDSRKRIVETTSTTYLPRDIPHGQRSGFPQSHYTARLAALPAAGSTIQVVFHSAHRDECEVARKS